MQIKDITQEDIKKFWKYVDKKSENECWLWHGSKARGYGRFRISNGTIGVHRFSFLLYNGYLTDDLNCLHQCDVKNCCNPKHLWLGTQADNVQDMVNKKRHKYGQKNPRAKLKDKDINIICQRYNNGETQISLANEYGVVPSLVSEIVCNKRWKENKNIVTKKRKFNWISQQTILKIRKEIVEGYTLIAMAQKYNLDKSHLSKILHGKVKKFDIEPLLGKLILGERNPQAKLNGKDILLIRSQIKNGKEQKDIAKQFNVSTATISNIIKRKTWKHI